MIYRSCFIPLDGAISVVQEFLLLDILYIFRSVWLRNDKAFWRDIHTYKHLPPYSKKKQRLENSQMCPLHHKWVESIMLENTHAHTHTHTHTPTPTHTPHTPTHPHTHTSPHTLPTHTTHPLHTPIHPHPHTFIFTSSSNFWNSLNNAT